jgi:uncharacterized protein (TIGR02145 family)
MKNVVKKQCKKSSLWRFKGLLSIALSGFGIVAFAQGAEVCQGTAYTIADAVSASAGSEYRWVENGLVLARTNRATYNVPDNKAAGVYTYVRQSKSADCPDWQSSNAFSVTVFACSFTAGTETGSTATFTDPRDGKRYTTVVMPDGKTWFAQNLNYTKDLTFNKYSYEANDQQFIVLGSGIPAIGSYWCPPQSWINDTWTMSVVSGSIADCHTYGALYTWETAMMVDGKYSDETKTNSAWDESWVTSNYYTEGAPGTTTNADKNNGRGGTDVKGGGRGICPKGWHVPTDREWAIMLDAVEGNTIYTEQSELGARGTIAAMALKSAATFTGGTDPGDGSWLVGLGYNGVNSTGFAAVPGGCRDGYGNVFSYRGAESTWWTSCVAWSGSAYYRLLGSNTDAVRHSRLHRNYGYNVRCVKD